MPSCLSKLTIAFIAPVLLTCLPLRADDAKPAPPKDQPSPVGEVRTQTLKGFTYFYSSNKMKFQDLEQRLGVLIPELRKGITASHAVAIGPMVFIYHGVTEDPSAEFDLEIGFPIQEKVEPAGNFKVRDVGKYHCMSVLFTGSFAQFSIAYEKLLPAVMGAPGVTKTTESREMYLYFESPDSPNNVVHVSAGIK